MTQVEISKIKVEDRIRKTFNNIEELAVEIDELGLINPITITKDFKLLAGERRLRAHKHLGRTHIEANIVDTDDEETQLLIEIKENETRESFTFSERMDYARRLERIEREKAVQRMSEGGKGVQNFAHVKTREVVADQVGFGSGEQYRKAKYVEANATDEVIEKLDTGEMSVHAAWKETKARLEQQVTDAETRAEQAEQRMLDAERSEEIAMKQLERTEEELAEKVAEKERELADARDALLRVQIPQVIEKEVVKEVIPEDMQRKYDAMVAESRQMEQSLARNYERIAHLEKLEKVVRSQEESPMYDLTRSLQTVNRYFDTFTAKRGFMETAIASAEQSTVDALETQMRRTIAKAQEVLASIDSRNGVVTVIPNTANMTEVVIYE